MNPKIIRLTLLSALCSLHFYTLADHITVSGNVSGEWNTDTVLVIGDLTVPDGENLLIQPGTTVEFQGSFAIYVAGSITASGYQSDSIFFQVADTAGFSVDSIPDGGWQGIRFDHNRTSNDPSVFYKCRFTNGKRVNIDPLAGNGGAIYVKAYNNVMITECTFRHNFATYNGGAISLDSADISISYSRFENNRCGLSVAPWGYGGAISSDNSSPDIRWNVFTTNSSTGIGGALSVRYKDCPVYNNIFTGNLSALGGALGVLHIPEIAFRINNNLFAENASLYFGGGVATINASPVYINNTIVNNSSTYGGGFYCKDSISPDFYNTIIWGNTAAVGSQGYMFEVFAQADFFNCDVEGSPLLFGGSGGGEAFSGAWENCLDEAPLFTGTGYFPYELSMDSPCIDAGSADTTGFLLPATDLAGLPRQTGAVIDIGAYEFWWESVSSATQNDEWLVWPNPTTGQFKVEIGKLKLDGGRVEIGKLKLEVCRVELADLYGNTLLVLEIPGHSDPVEIDISHLPDGVYLLRIREGRNNSSAKIIKISR